MADEKKGKLTKITVRGPDKGFRRAGFKFGPEAIEVEVNEEQLAAIKAEPELSIVPSSK